ncbi:amino acid ABC transporter permease [Geobacter sp. SVR]|uniref:amino acid ABC transporter permease n=1 Tax=Geobacter sp. SVR TaxID=2495594 RepID=UPI00143EFB47|nr:amino acid ABC transporter permease [Geobacter sp. SVR]BCS52849.1 amino acid ABC transporter permease [Geobacter sp. SVR]GCF86716.1 amino acid ABC transporter permease [Geobacter sp. SVR]
MKYLFSRAALALLFLWMLTGACFGAVDYDRLFRQSSDMMAQGDLEGALSLLAQVPSPSPGEDASAFVSSRMQAARIHASQNENEKALAACREVLKLFPDNSEARNFNAALEKQLKPRWHTVLSDVMRFLPALLKGAGMTLLLVLCTMLVSPLGGLLIALGRISTIRPLSVLCWFVIWFFRGTPLLLQLFFIYYGLPAFGITLAPLTAAVIGLGLNYSAYLGEIIRGAIQSIDHGQMEAAKAIGMSYRQAMRRVIIPQTYKRLMPPIGNEFIALIKDTALVSTIAMVELMRSADQLFNTYFNITALALAAVIYLLLTSVFTFVFEKIEYRAGIYEHR